MYYRLTVQVNNRLFGQITGIDVSRYYQRTYVSPQPPAALSRLVSTTYVDL